MLQASSQAALQWLQHSDVQDMTDRLAYVPDFGNQIKLHVVDCVGSPSASVPQSCNKRNRSAQWQQACGYEALMWAVEGDL